MPTFEKKFNNIVNSFKLKQFQYEYYSLKSRREQLTHEENYSTTLFWTEYKNKIEIMEKHESIKVKRKP